LTQFFTILCRASHDISWDFAFSPTSALQSAVAFFIAAASASDIAAAAGAGQRAEPAMMAGTMMPADRIVTNLDIVLRSSEFISVADFQRPGIAARIKYPNTLFDRQALFFGHCFSPATKRSQNCRNTSCAPKTKSGLSRAHVRRRRLSAVEPGH
jgi:hypothetical protein